MSWVAFLFSAVVIVVAGRLGQVLLGEEARLLALWSRVREGTLSRADSQVRMLEILEYLTSACTAILRAEPPPALVPPWRPIAGGT